MALPGAHRQRERARGKQRLRSARRVPSGERQGPTPNLPRRGLELVLAHWLRQWLQVRRPLRRVSVRAAPRTSEGNARHPTCLDRAPSRREQEPGPRRQLLKTEGVRDHFRRAAQSPQTMDHQRRPAATVVNLPMLWPRLALVALRSSDEHARPLASLVRGAVEQNREEVWTERLLDRNPEALSGILLAAYGIP